MVSEIYCCFITWLQGSIQLSALRLRAECFENRATICSISVGTVAEHVVWHASGTKWWLLQWQICVTNTDKSHRRGLRGDCSGEHAPEALFVGEIMLDCSVPFTHGLHNIKGFHQSVKAEAFANPHNGHFFDNCHHTFLFMCQNDQRILGIHEYQSNNQQLP